MKNNNFFFGSALTIISLWFLFDSVRVSSGGHGAITGFIHQRMNNGFETASMGLIFVPFVLGIISLIYTEGKKWTWFLTFSGISIILIEMLSRIRFLMNIKSSYLIIIFIMFSIGLGLILKSTLTKEKEEK